MADVMEKKQNTNMSEKETNGFLEYVQGMVKNFFDMIDKFTQMDLDQMVKLYSGKIDAEILRIAQEKELLYRGGQMTVTYVTKETFSVEIALYYQNHDGQWLEAKSVTAQAMDRLKPEAVEDLFAQKKVVYDIEAPKGKK